MLKTELLEQILLIGSILSAITCAFIQKTKFKFKSSHYLTLYSLIVNIVIGLLFSISFTTISFPISLWLGLFSFIGADTIYKTLEGRLDSFKDKSNDDIKISKVNIIERSDLNDGKTIISK